VILDARGASDVPGAKGLVLADVKKAKDDGRLPMEDHNTRILVVGANASQARALAEAVAKEAFNNVAFFAGEASQVHGAAPGPRTADK
jgi:PleD family two-component response regulator